MTVYGDLVKKHFPEVDKEDYNSILLKFTDFPYASYEEVDEELYELKQELTEIQRRIL